MRITGKGVFVIICSVVFYSCSMNPSNDNDLKTSIPNLSSIKDWANYKAIGVGSDNSSGRSISKSSSRSLFNDFDVYNPVLIGQLADNEIESVSFINSTNTEVEQNWHVGYLRNCDNILFVGFTTKTTDLFRNWIFMQGEQDANYLLDKKTGDLYSTDLFYVIWNGVQESQSSFFFNGFTTGQISDGAIYKGTFENHQLKLETVLDNPDIFPLGDVTQSWNVDRYSNLASPYFIIKSDLSMTVLDEEKVFKRGLNNILYTDDYLSQLDENGIIISSSFTPPYDYGFVLDSLNFASCISDDELAYYFFFSGTDENMFYNFDNNTGYNPKSIKLVFSDSSKLEYSFEEIPFQNAYFDTCESLYGHIINLKGIKNGNRIYFHNETEIFYNELTTGEKTTLYTAFKITSLESDGCGNLVFTAVTQSLETIEGFIDSNNVVNTDMTSYERGYEVTFLDPIN